MVPTTAEAEAELIGRQAQAQKHERTLKSVDGGTSLADHPERLECLERSGGSQSRCIGFMLSAKVAVAVGGLLQTGGGRPTALDLGKSLVLRGCICQKMGRRLAAQEDYYLALDVCTRTRRVVFITHFKYVFEL